MKSSLRILALLLTTSTVVACSRVYPMDDDDDGDDADAPDAAPAPDSEPPPECTSDAQCSSDEPVCGDDQTCRGCALDAECPSGACNLETGACYAAAEVIVVSPSGLETGPCGGATNPCRSINTAGTQVTTGRSIVRMLPGSYGTQNVLPVSVPFIVDGHGATTGWVFLHTGVDMTVIGARIEVATPSGATNPWRAIDVNPGSRLVLRDVVIRGSGIAANGNGTTGIELEGTLIAENLDLETTNGVGIYSYLGDLVLRRSRIHGCKYGALIASPKYELTNNVISHNTTQGVRIDSPPGMGTKWVEFNTFIANGAAITNGTTELEVVRAGFTTHDQRFSARGNLFVNGRAYVWNPTTSTGLRPMAGVIARYSLIDVPNYPPGDETNVYAPAQLTLDGHLTATSPAIDGVAATEVSVTEDLDGDIRPAGAPADIGADEYQP